jgi:superfamily II DNA or RNA helicase
MNTIKIENNYSWLHTEDEKLRLELWKALRWKEKNYFHNARYRMKLWDGFKNFFDKDTGKFLTGLLPEVKLFIKNQKQEYQCIDNRDPVKFGIESVTEDFLGNGVKLRDYQVDYINQAIKNRRGIVFAPTSSGKTNVMIGILKALPPNTPTLVLANRTSLVDQNYDEITKAGIANVGRFYGGKKEANMITCATVQSAHLLKPLLPKIRCLIVDEIHEMMSKKPRQVYAACKAASVRLGFSATPFKFGESDQCQKYEVKGYIGPVFLAKNTATGRLTTKELQIREILASAECTFRPIRNPDLPYHTYIDAVTEGIAENDEFHQINKRLVDTLDGRILIIVERLEHGDRLLDLIPDAVWVRGQDTIETRKVVINRLKEEKGKIVAIATSGIFNTGLNVFVHHLINSAGGQAEHQIVQRFGRGLRRASDKDHVYYHDWYFHNNDYLEKHSKKRIAVLKKEGHNVKVLDELDI